VKAQPAPGAVAVYARYRRTCDRLGISYTERETWTRNSYGATRHIDLMISAEGLAELKAELARTHATRARAAIRRAEVAKRVVAEREALAENLGLLPDSRTFAAYLRGEIEENEARGIGRYTAHRHEETDYDDLLARGVSKEDAREMSTAQGGAL
jgi:hypothetical protein